MKLAPEKLIVTALDLEHKLEPFLTNHLLLLRNLLLLHLGKLRLLLQLGQLLLLLQLRQLLLQLQLGELLLQLGHLLLLQLG